MHPALKIIQVILLSSVKFLLAFPLSFGYGFNYWETILLTCTGGLMGVFVFYFLSTAIIRLYRLILRKIRHAFGVKRKETAEKKKKKQFTRRNKFLVRLRGKYGMLGIIALTPTILSIPIGCFVINKYYSENKFVLLYLCISVIIWSLIVSNIYFFNLIVI